MDIFTHFLMAIFISIYTLYFLPFSIVLYAVILAVIPDFDIILEPLRRIKKSNFLSHKGLSHSLFSAFAFSFITTIIFTIITKEDFFIAWIMGFLFYSLHILLDFVAASKIPIFYPFSKKRYRFFIDRAINFPLALVSGLILLFYTLIFFFLPQLFFSNLYNYFFGFYITYFSYRIVSKIWIQTRLPPSALYIPGVIPFTYLIYEKINTENSDTFRLKKKIQFMKKNHIIFESKLLKTPEDLKFYDKAIDLAKDYVFFTKWVAIIPVIKKSNDQCTVILILAESYFRKSVYGLKVIFNRRSELVEQISEGFNIFRLLSNFTIS
ncbi:MAG: metal-dependent hydrolase [Promethearchaeota archaeon]